VLLAPYFALRNTHTNFKQIVVITHTHKHKWPPIKPQSKKIQTSYQTSYQAQHKKFHTISNLLHFTSELFHTHLHFKPPTKGQHKKFRIHIKSHTPPLNCSTHIYTSNLPQSSTFKLFQPKEIPLHTQQTSNTTNFASGHKSFKPPNFSF